ncbi:MAG: Hsp20/alpha crystallin family protein [Acidobacteria bacterium]|nr:Hsp20/alpha crystallin family protein [Acidobacteriota bacterium]
MALSRWDPFRDMTTLQERMNKLFEDSLTRSRATDQEFPMGSWTPAVDVYETDEKVVLKADLPGIDQKDIDLRIEDGTLIIRGERKFDKEKSQEDFHRIERAYGSFHRTFRLPGSVDQAAVHATHKDGVLEVVLTKKAETRPRQIKVEVK